MSAALETFPKHIEVNESSSTGNSFFSFGGNLLYSTKKLMVFKRGLKGLHDSCSSQIDCSFSLYSLALTRVSFRDFPLRYEMRGGSLKLFVRYGWFCIRCHFPMSIFLRLGNAGWYCITKVVFSSVHFCFSVLVLSFCQRN